MRKQPPHSFTLYGNKWNVKFIDPLKVPRLIGRAQRKLLKGMDLNMEGFMASARTTGRRDIYLKPGLRTNWTNFAHELLHALFAEKGDHQKAKGWKREPITHAQIDKIAEPLGQFLKENMK